jgi:uncharacterized RDD family membrane protein YckC
MDWYYSVGGERKGPVPEDELMRLAHSGVVIGSTLVWKQGMADWRPFAEAGPGFPPPVPPAVFATTGVTPPPPTAVVRYGGFWIRVCAYILDGIILGIVQGVLFGLLFGGSILNLVGDAMSGRLDASPDLAVGVLPMVFAARFLGFVLSGAYFAWFWAQYGATPGKMVFGLKVINPDGTPISIGQAIGRYLGTLLSWIIIGIGFIMAGFDDQKRALHDRLVNTRVIYIK